MRCFLIFLGVITSASAALVEIMSPPNNSNLTRGEPFIVSVLKPNYVQATTDIGVAIAVGICGSMPCPDKSEILGDVVYSGGYDPTTPLPPPRNADYYQNYTVTIPTTLSTGPAALSVVHTGLAGAGPNPFTEIVNITVFLQ